MGYFVGFVIENPRNQPSQKLLQLAKDLFASWYVSDREVDVAMLFKKSERIYQLCGRPAH